MKALDEVREEPYKMLEGLSEGGSIGHWPVEKERAHWPMEPKENKSTEEIPLSRRRLETKERLYYSGKVVIWSDIWEKIHRLK